MCVCVCVSKQLEPRLVQGEIMSKQERQNFNDKILVAWFLQNKTFCQSKLYWLSEKKWGKNISSWVRGFSGHSFHAACKNETHINFAFQISLNTGVYLPATYQALLFLFCFIVQVSNPTHQFWGEYFFYGHEMSDYFKLGRKNVFVICAS